MTASRPDGLLSTARAVLGVLLILFWVAIAALAIALVAIFIERGDIAREFGAAGVSPGGISAILTGMALGAGAIIFLGTHFIRRLIAIVESVADDPFVRVNAVRLHEMAWLMLSIQVGTGLLSGYMQWMMRYLHLPDGVDASGDLDLFGFVLVLILFLLARVFERGADMRDDLEGTV